MEWNHRQPAVEIRDQIWTLRLVIYVFVFVIRMYMFLSGTSWSVNFGVTGIYVKESCYYLAHNS